MSLRDIGLELQQLELDFQVVVFADIARFVSRFADVDRVLEALQVFLGQCERRFRQLNADELRGGLEGDRALVIGHLRARDRGLVLRRLEAVLALPSALEEIAETEVKLGRVIEVAGVELAGLKDRKKLRVAQQHRVRPQVRGNLLGLALLDRGARGLQRVVVLEGQLNGLIEGDSHGPLRLSGKRARKGEAGEVRRSQQ